MSQLGTYNVDYINFFTGNIGGKTQGEKNNITLLGVGPVVVTGFPGTGTLEISVTGLAADFNTDVGGPVVPTAFNAITMHGGNNITTDGTVANTVTFNLTGTTLYALQVGNALGTLGQVLMSNGVAGDPSWENGGSISLGITEHAIPVGLAGGNLFSLPLALTGETLMGATGADPSWTGSPSFSGAVTAGTGFTATLGDVAITSGDLTLPQTTALVGHINFGGNTYIRFPEQSSVFMGYLAGNDTYTGVNNVGIGDTVCTSITTASENAAVGSYSLYNLTTSELNSAFGCDALRSLKTGLGRNTAIGRSSLTLITTGEYNTCIGAVSGSSYTSSDSSNISVGYGVYGSPGENHTLRIGTATGTGNGEINRSFIAGIYNTTIGATSTVVLSDSTNQIGGLPNGGAGTVLTMGATAPSWQAFPSGGITWSTPVGAFNLVKSNGYFCDDIGLQVATLPAVAAVGDTFRIIAVSAGGWQIIQNSGQWISFSTASTIPTSGSVYSTHQGDSLELVCYVANDGFYAVSSVGNIQYD